MSKKLDRDLSYAQELIQRKQYDKARKLLQTINHPQAHQLLAELNQMPPINQRTRMLGLTPAVVIIIGVVACVGLIILGALLQSAGILPRGYETKTAEAHTKSAARATQQFNQDATVTILALTPSATFTSVPATMEIPTMTPSSTPSPADRAASVVRNLRGTSISDNDFRDSTSGFDDRAVIKLFLSDSVISPAATIRQVRHDYPILACQLRAAGFTKRIAITGTANFIDSAGKTTELKAIEVQLNEQAIADLPCEDLTNFDILTTNDGLYIHPAIDFDPTAAIDNSLSDKGD